MATSRSAELFAIVLAGGASSRLHATSPRPVANKPLLEIGGKPLISHTLEAIQKVALSDHIVVVGPAKLPTGKIPTVYEDPPQAGPYLAVRTGLHHFTRVIGPARNNQGVLLLAADMPHIELGLKALAEHHRDPDSNSQVAIVTTSGQVQPLLSYVPRRLAAELFSEHVLNAGLWHTLGRTPYRSIELPVQAGADIDTYQDAVRHGVWFDH